MDTIGLNYLTSVGKRFAYYKDVAEQAIAQVDDAHLHWQFNAETNSIATIIKHMAGNSLSRWTNFMTEDGEKPWRNRDSEFEDSAATRGELLAFWDRGWQCLFDALASLTENDLLYTIYIRKEPHTVMEAINRQLAHLPYHVGQIVYIAKMVSGDWKALTIPKGMSGEFNKGKGIS